MYKWNTCIQMFSTSKWSTASIKQNQCDICSNYSITSKKTPFTRQCIEVKTEILVILELRVTRNGKKNFFQIKMHRRVLGNALIWRVGEKIKGDVNAVGIYCNLYKQVCSNLPQILFESIGGEGLGGDGGPFSYFSSVHRWASQPDRHHLIQSTDGPVWARCLKTQRLFGRRQGGNKGVQEAQRLRESTGRGRAKKKQQSAWEQSCG